MSSIPRQVKLVEVGPRDGLQNEKEFVPTEIKIALIQQLASAGLKVIEATSFVSAKAIPQLADHQNLFKSLDKNNGVEYPVLVPNLEGLENAISVGATHIAVFTTPSEAFSQHNTHCSVAESLARIEKIMQRAKKLSLPVRGYISCVLGCPYEGEMNPEKVAAQAKILWEMGCEEISLGDTIGVGTPLVTQKLIKKVSDVLPITAIAVHFHDTYGQALANIFAALQLGVAIIDSSIAGLGGCPYAKGATGNVATEEVVYLLNGMGIATGVNLQKLIYAGEFISHALGRVPQSKVNNAMRAK